MKIFSSTADLMTSTIYSLIIIQVIHNKIYLIILLRQNQIQSFYIVMVVSGKYRVL